jgi:hypothetical protein
MMSIVRKVATTGVVLALLVLAGGYWLASGSSALPARVQTQRIVVPALLSHESALTPTRTPLWDGLSAAQRKVLLPLQADWDTLDSNRQLKWKKIADHYPSMTQAQQQRAQKRMHDWVNLTPDQRTAARKNYARAGTMNSAKKTAQWEEYQRLTEVQKRQFSKSARNAP